jgi:acetyl-CoA C-acetyltransferase
MMFDGLTCAFDHCAMGLGTERYNAGRITRQRQDEFSAASHAKAAAAIAAGKLAEEIVAVEIPQRKGDPIVVVTDEGVRVETTFETLSALRPAFDKEGTITAGNASQISDGAAAVIVMSADKAAELGLTPLGELVSYGQVAGPDASLLNQPSRAIATAAAKAGLDVKGLDLFEINEAFAAVGLASTDELGVDEAKVNVNGGAIALGHPVGMSGTRVALTALHELRRRGGGTAAVALCGGGGQGDAAIVRTLSSALQVATRRYAPGRSSPSGTSSTTAEPTAKPSGPMPGKVLSLRASTSSVTVGLCATTTRLRAVASSSLSSNRTMSAVTSRTPL